MRLRYAYNTNGAANHRLDDALNLIADCGYDGVALTLDHHHFDPFAPDFTRRGKDLKKKLDELKLGLVIETGARFLLDPKQKHEPTLISQSAAGRARRVEFLKRAVDLAQIAEAEAVSFWAGVRKAEVSNAEAQIFLREGLKEVCEYALAKNVCVAFEPEPGMLVETVADYRKLENEFPNLTLALDTGHCLASREGKPEKMVREMREKIGTVAVEDMKHGIHEHLFFGEGDMDIPEILKALKEIKYQRLVCVELSRHSHCADKIIPAAIVYLRKTENEIKIYNDENAIGEISISTNESSKQ